MDLTVPLGLRDKRRVDWGLQNMVAVDHPNPQQAKNNANTQRTVHNKINTFFATAVYPQQLCIPRQYSTTAPGLSIVTVMKGRIVKGYQEDGVRVVVQENAQRARFLMSPLFGSETDARSWAKQQTGVS